jgi:hypothetical protein
MDVPWFPHSPAFAIIFSRDSDARLSAPIEFKTYFLSAPRAKESATDDSFACHVIDEGGPLGVVVQARAPNYLPLLRSKGRGSEQRRLKGP